MYSSLDSEKGSVAVNGAANHIRIEARMRSFLRGSVIQVSAIKLEKLDLIRR